MLTTKPEPTNTEWLTLSNGEPVRVYTTIRNLPFEPTEEELEEKEPSIESP